MPDAGTLHPEEHFEDMRDILRTDADAGIRNHKAVPADLLVLLRQLRDGEGDAAALGRKLDGIADQIFKNLMDAQNIADAFVMADLEGMTEGLPLFPARARARVTIFPLPPAG